MDITSNPRKYLIILAIGMGLWILVSALMWPQMNYDEGMWNYVADMWRNHDLAPYVHTLENKPPGIYLLYYVINSFFGITFWIPRVVGIVTLIGCGFLVYTIARHLTSVTSAFLAATIFALTMGWQITDGQLPGHTETFMISFSTAAFLVFFLKPLKVQNSLLIGLLLGAATASKQIALASACAMAIAILLRARHEKITMTSTLGLIFVFGAGILLATFMSILPLLLSGVSVEEYWKQAWLALLEGDGNSPSHFGIRVFRAINTWSSPELIPFYPILVFFVINLRKLEKAVEARWVLIWFVFDFVGVNAAGYYYGHQLRQMMPSLCVLCAFVIHDLFNSIATGISSERKTALALMVIMILGLLPGSLFQLAEFRWNLPADDRVRVAEWIRNNSTGLDFCYVYDKHANIILANARRKCPTRYFDLSFIRRQGALDEIRTALNKTPPKVVVIGTKTKIPDWINEALDRYEKVTTIGVFDLYLRSHAPKTP